MHICLTYIKQTRLLILRLEVLLFLSSIILSLTACGPRYIRSGEDKDFEKSALSTRLDRSDLEKLFSQSSSNLMKSTLMRSWRNQSRDGRQATLAILPIENETSEHVDNALMTLVKQLETKLINEGNLTVISRAQQPNLLKELRTQQGAAFDMQRVAQMGKQLGAQYFLTGRLYDVTEKSVEARRVQYFLFVQVIEVETGAIRWQINAEIMKGLL